MDKSYIDLSDDCVSLYVNIYRQQLVLFAIPTNVLTDSGTIIISKFLEMICSFTKDLESIVYHLQTSSQEESFNKMIAV